MISFHLARYLVDSYGEVHRGCRSPGPSRWRIQTAAKLAPRENVRRELVPAPADKFSRKKLWCRKELKIGVVPRTSEGDAGESGANAKQTHVCASTRTHRPRWYPNENNTPSFFLTESLFFRRFFFRGLCFRRIILKGRGFFPIHRTMFEGIPVCYLKG